jgi:hypothetical protein
LPLALISSAVLGVAGTLFFRLMSKDFMMIGSLKPFLNSLCSVACILCFNTGLETRKSPRLRDLSYSSLSQSLSTASSLYKLMPTERKEIIASYVLSPSLLLCLLLHFLVPIYENIAPGYDLESFSNSSLSSLLRVIVLGA